MKESIPDFRGRNPPQRVPAQQAEEMRLRLTCDYPSDNQEGNDNPQGHRDAGELNQ
jgi:hypothetical protein